MKKKKKRSGAGWLGWLLALCLVGGLVALPKILSDNKEEESKNVEILTEAAENRSIEEKIVAGGQLTGETGETADMPESLKIESYTVANGDYVNAGDTIALVDRISVMTAITEVQSTLETLTERIQDASGDSTEKITASVSGRVKQIFGSEGDTVEDVMLSCGSLAVISPDNLMAFKVTTETKAAISEKLTVTLADGTEITATVKSNINGEIIAVVEDEGYEIGTVVTAVNAEGVQLGSGELYVYNAWNLLAYNGTITGVKAEVQDTVSAGDTIYTIKGVEASTEFTRLVDKRQKYEQLLHELFLIYETGVITAPCDGVVSGVDTTGAYMLSVVDDSAFRVALLSETETRVMIVTESLPQGTVGATYGYALQAAAGNSLATGTWAISDLPAGLTLDPASGLISGTPTTTYQNRVTVSFTAEDGTVLTAEYTLVIAATTQQETRYQGYIARVLEAAKDGIRIDVTKLSYPIDDMNTLPKVENPEDELKEGKTEEATCFDPKIEEAQYKEGDIIWLIYDPEGNLVKTCLVDDTTQGGTTPGGDIPGGTTPGGDNGSGTGGSMPGGSGGFSGGGFSGGGFSGGSFGGGSFSGSGSMPGGTVDEDVGLYSMAVTSIATVTPQNVMTISIEIDELDITKLHTGMTAEITMNALPGVTAEATIIYISNSGSNNGGNTKFTVELELPRSEDILPGMNATCTIVLNTLENVLTVPAAAVYEKDGTCYVYTAVDETTGELTGEKNVEIGAADADFVEIISGLFAGDKVCYENYIIESESEGTTPNMSFGPLSRT